MRREFIVVVGNQGYGKTVWTKLYTAQRKRVLVYDPKAEYPVDFVTTPDEYIPAIAKRERAEFRFGTYLPEEIPMFANAAFAAGKTTLVFEECALVFRKGEDLPDYLRPMVFMGREPELDFVLAAQRAVSIPPDVRTQANRIVTFLQTDPADVRAISQRIGREWEEEIPRLDVLECLDWQPGQGVKRYRIKY